MEIEPLVATIATTARILECSDQTVRELIGRGELESFLDGRIRKVMMLSIKGYVARKLAANAKGREPHNSAAGRVAGLKTRRARAAGAQP